METGTEHYKYCTVSMQQSPHTVLWTTNTVHAVSMYHRDPILTVDYKYSSFFFKVNNIFTAMLL